MIGQNRALIDKIRLQSRRLVRAWGFMDETLAGTQLSSSGVHAIIEIGSRRASCARELAKLLRLEKSTVSRLIARLMEDELVEEVTAPGDARVKQLQLSNGGRKLYREVTQFARQQVHRAISPLPSKSMHKIADGLTAYADALHASQQETRTQPTSAEPEIIAGYQAGILGRIAELHANYYSQNNSFGREFETKVAAEYAEFLHRVDNPVNETWAAMLGGEIVGGITVDGEDLEGNIAHLRWFIVDENWHGAAIGTALMRVATEFVDRNKFDETHLWTFQGLDAARHLYEKNGFHLVDQRTGRQWGTKVVEQQFQRNRTFSGTVG